MWMFVVTCHILEGVGIAFEGQDCMAVEGDYLVCCAPVVSANLPRRPALEEVANRGALPK